MNKSINGNTTLLLAEPDQAGNVDYSLTFDYQFNKDDIQNSFSYSNIKFSGPGTWEEYACGDDYPLDKMIKQAIYDHEQKPA